MHLLTLAGVTLEDIGKLVDSKIFQRGVEYFKEGAVLNPVIDGNQISAEVEGSSSSNYRTSAKLVEGKLKGECDCPYDWGVCKHIIALLLHWIKRRDEFEDVGKKVTEIENMQNSDLVKIVKTLAKEEPQIFSQMLDLALPHKAQRNAKARDYSQQIKRAIERGADWSEMNGLLRQLRAIRKRILVWRKTGEYDYVATQLFDVVQAVLESYGRCDDSSGNLSVFHDECLEEILKNWEELNEKTKAKLLIAAWERLCSDEYGFEDTLEIFIERVCKGQFEREVLKKPIINTIVKFEEAGAKKAKNSHRAYEYKRVLQLAKRFGYINKQGVYVNRD